MEQEVLTIQVAITGTTQVQGARGNGNMVAFTGRVDCPLFQGVILPGGIDTQTMVKWHLTLSARYILEGTDSTGRQGRIFIENNGESDDPATPMITHPRIFTDCLSLQWLEEASLYGPSSPCPKAKCASTFFPVEPFFRTTSLSCPAGQRIQRRNL